MSKVHPEAFVEWTVTGNIAAGTTNGTINGPAALAFVRCFIVHVSVSFAAATVTTVGTITINFGASSSFVFQVPVGVSGLYLALTQNKATRCDVNFQPTVVLAGFTAASGPAVSVNIGGYKVRE